MEHLNVLCYSHEGFNDYMREREWYQKPGDDTATISICSPNDDDPMYWFQDMPYGNNINLDFDDFDPSKYWDHDMYDELLDKFMFTVDSETDWIFKSDNCDTGKLKAMSYMDAYMIVNFIHNMLIRGVRTFVIHCSAGISRSQGIVRFIQDTYSDRYDIVTRKDNPCITPNIHVVRMLKRIYRNNIEFCGDK